MIDKKVAKIMKFCYLCSATARQLLQTQSCVPRYIRSYSTTDYQNADIVISGGGMVGAAMACVLGHESLLANKRIVLLEAAPRKPFELKESYSNRTCTLSPGSVQLFDRCGVWEEIQNTRCHQVHGMQVWESCSNSLITFNQQDMTEELAYVAENDVILEAITRRLDAIKDRVDVMYSTKAEEIHIPGTDSGPDSNTFVEIKLNDGTTLKTKLLIGSDGMNSSVRKAADFHTVSFKYDQKAVVAVLNIEETSNNVAWQRFLPTGPIALLPLSDSAFSMIWTTSPENAGQLMSLSDETFVSAVNDALSHDRDININAERASGVLENLLRTFVSESGSVRQLPPAISGVQEQSRATFPLGLTHSSNYVRHRVALIGDAAHRLHPLAGQGVNLGFGDVQKLAEIITTAAHNGSDLGALTYLKEYETSRQRRVLPVMATIDGLQRLYSTDFAPLVLLRTLGLQTTNALKPLKDRIIQEATK